MVTPTSTSSPSVSSSTSSTSPLAGSQSPVSSCPIPANPVSANSASAKPAVVSSTAVLGRPVAGKPSAVSSPTASRAAVSAAERPISSEPKVAPQPAASPVDTMSDTSAIWKEFFNNWPEGIPTRGIVVNQLNEQLPFKAYMVKGDVVMLERTNPDTLGSRYILVPYSEIGIVKLTDPLNQEKFDNAGFKGTLSK